MTDQQDSGASPSDVQGLADELERDYPTVDVTTVCFSRDFAGVGCCVIPQDRVLAIVAALRSPALPAGIPVKLTGEIACILENCDPPEKQTDEAVERLIFDYQPTWDRLREFLRSTVPAGMEAREALGRIAKFATSAELRASVDAECAKSEFAASWHASAPLADFRSHYDACITIARTAEAALASQSPSARGEEE